MKPLPRQLQPTDKLLKAVEVAQRLNISKAFAYQLMLRGDIPTVKIGSARRVKEADLINYIQQNISGN